MTLVQSPLPHPTHHPDVEYRRHLSSHHQRMVSNLTINLSTIQPLTSLPSHPHSHARNDDNDMMDSGSSYPSASSSSTSSSSKLVRSPMSVTGPGLDPQYEIRYHNPGAQQPFVHGHGQYPFASSSASPSFPRDSNGDVNGHGDAPQYMTGRDDSNGHGQLYDTTPLPDGFWTSNPSSTAFAGMNQNFMTDAKFGGLQLEIPPPFAKSYNYGQAPVPYNAQQGMTLPYGFTGPPVMSANGSTSINPGFLRTTTPSPIDGEKDIVLDEESIPEQQYDYPSSPLRALSPPPSDDLPGPDDDDASPKAKPRRKSDGGLSYESAKPKSSSKVRHKRKMTWNGNADEGPSISQAQKETELLHLAELEAGGSATRRERRRLQNRLAQRAFRARSKVQNHEFHHHMQSLEETVEEQTAEIKRLNETVHRLEKENLALKAKEWAAMSGYHGDVNVNGRS